MNASAEKAKIFREIEYIPEERLPDVYTLLHHFRLELEEARPASRQVMRFAGSWADMPDDVFAAFTGEVMVRRRQAFTRRRAGGASAH